MLVESNSPLGYKLHTEHRNGCADTMKINGKTYRRLQNTWTVMVKIFNWTISRKNRNNEGTDIPPITLVNKKWEKPKDTMHN